MTLNSSRFILPIIVAVGITTGLLLGRCVGAMLERSEGTAHAASTIASNSH